MFSIEINVRARREIKLCTVTLTASSKIRKEVCTYEKVCAYKKGMLNLTYAICMVTPKFCNVQNSCMVTCTCIGVPNQPLSGKSPPRFVIR